MTKIEDTEATPNLALSCKVTLVSSLTFFLQMYDFDPEENR